MLFLKVILILTFSISANKLLAQTCPKSIRVNSVDAIAAKDTLVFSAELTGYNSTVTYNWTISGGKIESGQGSSSIKVNSEGMGGKTITATVEIGGLPRGCSSSASATTGILEAAQLILAEKYTGPACLNTAVDNYIKLTDLKDLNVDQLAFIYVYAGATTTSQQLNQIKTQFRLAFDRNKVMEFQYIVKDGGKKNDAFFEIYKMKSTAVEPKPSK